MTNCMITTYKQVPKMAMFNAKIQVSFLDSSTLQFGINIGIPKKHTNNLPKPGTFPDFKAIFGEYYQIDAYAIGYQYYYMISILNE